MEHPFEYTAEEILRNRPHHVEPGDEGYTALVTPTGKQLRQASAAQFRAGCDAGVWKRLLSLVLEPKNRFDAKASRDIRPETAVIGGLTLLAVLLAIYFNAFAAR